MLVKASVSSRESQGSKSRWTITGETETTMTQRDEIQRRHGSTVLERKCMKRSPVKGQDPGALRTGTRDAFVLTSDSQFVGSFCCE